MGKPRAVQKDRLRPITVDRVTRDQIIVAVLPMAVHDFDIGVNEPKLSVAVRKRLRRRDAAGIGIARHVQLAQAIEGLATSRQSLSLSNDRCLRLGTIRRWRPQYNSHLQLGICSDLD